MMSRLQPDRTRTTATERRRMARPAGTPGGLPGWRPWAAAVAVVAALALFMYLLYR